MAELPDSVKYRISCAHRIWYPSDSLLLDSLARVKAELEQLKADSIEIESDQSLSPEEKKEQRRKRREQKQLEKMIKKEEKEGETGENEENDDN